jgi:hypothetical protein
MNKKLYLLATTVLALTSACSSDTKYEQTNTFSLIAAMQAPNDDVVISTPTMTTKTDVYNPNSATTTFTSLVLPSGVTANPEVNNLSFGYNDDKDRLLLTTNSATTATGFGGLSMSDFKITITNNNTAVKASFEDGTKLFGITNPVTFYSNTFVHLNADLTADPYETNEYTKNQIILTFNATKKTVNLVIYSAYFNDSSSNLNLIYQGLPYTIDPSTGIISITPSGDIVPLKYANNITGDKLEEYTASNFRAYIYGTFDLPSYIEFTTPAYKVTYTLYEYGNLPNAD